MKMKHRKRVVVLVLLLVIVLTALSSCGESPLGTEQNPIVMSFIPWGDTQEIITGGEQLAQMINQKTGLVVKSIVSTGFAATREAMASEKVHVGWLNPFNYVLAYEELGVDVALVAVRSGSITYMGQIITQADSGISTIADLKGKTMCWVDPTSTSGYVIPRIMLKANGVDPDKDFAKTIETGSHTNVVTAVYRGDCDVGATFFDARSFVAKDIPDINAKVVILATTTEIPNDTVTFIKDFPVDMRDDIVQALLDIAQSDEGKEALKKSYDTDGLQLVQDSFYDAFRADLTKAGFDIEELAK